MRNEKNTGISLAIANGLPYAIAEGVNVRIKREFTHACIWIRPGLYDVCEDCGGTGLPPFNLGHKYCVKCLGIGITPHEESR